LDKEQTPGETSCLGAEFDAADDRHFLHCSGHYGITRVKVRRDLTHQNRSLGSTFSRFGLQWEQYLFPWREYKNYETVRVKNRR